MCNIFGYFEILITVVAEIVIEKSVMRKWQNISSSKRWLLILRQEIF